jgi:hypothetical protein
MPVTNAAAPSQVSFLFARRASLLRGCTCITGMGAYKYLEELWRKKQSDCAWRVRAVCAAWPSRWCREVSTGDRRCDH